MQKGEWVYSILFMYFVEVKSKQLKYSRDLSGFSFSLNNIFAKQSRRHIIRSLRVTYCLPFSITSLLVYYYIALFYFYLFFSIIFFSYIFFCKSWYIISCHFSLSAVRSFRNGDSALNEHRQLGWNVHTTDFALTQNKHMAELETGLNQKVVTVFIWELIRASCRDKLSNVCVCESS
jgi:hypothetical protein